MRYHALCFSIWSSSWNFSCLSNFISVQLGLALCKRPKEICTLIFNRNLVHFVTFWQYILDWLEKAMLKNIFVEVKNKFETAIGILKKEKITIDPEDPAAVSHYAQVIKTVREKWVSALPYWFLSDSFCSIYSWFISCNYSNILLESFFNVLIMLCQLLVHSAGQTCCQSPKIS